MGESFNYIEVLCRVGSATMTASEDWAQSIGSVKKYADMLGALDYNIMYAEAQQPNAKKTLEKWSSREVRCWSLCWLIRNAKQMYKWLEKLLGNDFREIAEAQKDKGTWTFEQWRDYRFMCDDVQYQWQERLDELLSAYGYEAADIYTVSANQSKEIVSLFRSEIDCASFFRVVEKNASQWGKKTGWYMADGRLKREYGVARKIFTEITQEHPEITSWGSYIKQIPKIR